MKDFLISLSRLQKRLLFISVDVVTISLALWLALIIRQDSFFNFSNGYELTGASAFNLYSILLLANIFIISTLIVFRLYRSITRYISIETYVKITKASTIGTGAWALVVYTLHLPFPRSVFIIFFIISTFFLFLTRYVARSFLTQQEEKTKHTVLIYGTSQEAIDINEMFKNNNSILNKGFISNDLDHKKTVIAELPVYTLKDINKIIDKKNIKEILITYSNQSKNKLKSIVKELDKHHRIIRKLPNIKDLASGTIKLLKSEVLFPLTTFAYSYSLEPLLL